MSLNPRIWWFALIGLAANLALSLYQGSRSAARGFDQVHYLNLLRDGWASISDGTTTTYYASKSLPFLIGNLIFDSGDYEFLAGTFWSMTLLNTCLLLFTAWGIARVLKLQGMVALVPAALTILLCNQAFVSFYAFYPRLPDIFMLALGTLFLLGHFEDRRVLVWSCLALSTLTATQLTLFLLAYLVFRNGRAEPSEDSRAIGRQQLAWSVMMASLVLGVGLWAIFIAPHQTVAVAESWGSVVYFKSYGMVALSVVATAIAIWWASLPLGYWNWRDVLRSLHPLAAAAAVAIVVIVASLVGMLAVESQGLAYANRGLLIKMSYFLTKPAAGPLSHVVFFGMIGSFAMLTWKDFSRWLASEGPGLTIAFTLSLVFFGLDGEVRHVIFLVPVMVVGICHSAKESLVEIRISTLIWMGLAFSITGYLLMSLDADYHGNRRILGFGICWSKLHYAAAIGIVSAALWISWEALRRPRSGLG